MPPPPFSDEAIRRQEVLIAELSGQSDRAVAIVGAAWVEEAIVGSLHKYLGNDAKAWKRLFGSSGPLATFSAKIDLTRLLGLVTPAIHSDLHAIREVRNEFAHKIAHDTTHELLSFSIAKVSGRCLALKCVAHEHPTDARTAFVRACAILNADFQLLQWFVPTPHLTLAMVSAKIGNNA